MLHSKGRGRINAGSQQVALLDEEDPVVEAEYDDENVHTDMGQESDLPLQRQRDVYRVGGHSQAVSNRVKPVGNRAEHHPDVHVEARYQQVQRDEQASPVGTTKKVAKTAKRPRPNFTMIIEAPAATGNGTPRKPAGPSAQLVQVAQTRTPNMSQKGNPLT